MYVNDEKMKACAGKEYDFLRTNKNLNHIILLALGGSRAYGTNLPTSDTDIRGIALPTKEMVVGIDGDFEQASNSDTDTVIYSLIKMVKLLLNCNPNCIEILGDRPEDYLLISDEGQKILDIKSAFLSKKAINSFGGYATAQYNRLEHGLLGNGENDDKKVKMMKHSLDCMMAAFNEEHKNCGTVAEIKEFNGVLRLTGSFDSNVDDIECLLKQIRSINDEYGNINKRNTKKTDVKLAKHMMHLIRLYLMGIDLNAEGKIITYREKEHDLLMSIRNGDYMTEDGFHVIPEFYDLLQDIQSRYIYSVKNTVLPDTPDKEAIKATISDIYKTLF